MLWYASSFSRYSTLSVKDPRRVYGKRSTGEPNLLLPSPGKSGTKRVVRSASKPDCGLKLGAVSRVGGSDALSSSLAQRSDVRIWYLNDAVSVETKA